MHAAESLMWRRECGNAGRLGEQIPAILAYGLKGIASDGRATAEPTVRDDGTRCVRINYGHGLMNTMLEVTSQVRSLFGDVLPEDW
jgi:hypothetical protein